MTSCSVLMKREQLKMVTDLVTFKVQKRFRHVGEQKSSVGPTLGRSVSAHRWVLSRACSTLAFARVQSIQRPHGQASRQASTTQNNLPGGPVGHCPAVPERGGPIRSSVRE